LFFFARFSVASVPFKIEISIGGTFLALVKEELDAVSITPDPGTLIVLP